MSTHLERIGEKARTDPKLVFTSLYHHISDIDNLRTCYERLPKGKAAGVDGVTKEEYGKELETNLQRLSEALKRQGYRPRPKRRSYIPKPGSNQGRPLGISCFEDKIVELAVKRVLEPIYEPIFTNSSYGYRPGRSQHGCIDEVGRTIQQKRINYIVEADIKSYFDEVDHGWMITFLQQRIGDPRVIELIRRMLKSGILEDGLVKATEMGTPQGSVLSPLLSNIYLHYALDVWFGKFVREQSQGEGYYFRYADDFVACFQYQSDADMFLKELEERMLKFELKIAPEKTRQIAFGRYARKNARNNGKKPEEFTFLGFTHYCGKTKHGYFKVKRRTSRKKRGQSLQKLTAWARGARGKMKKGEFLRAAKRRIEGHLNYYAITDNGAECCLYVRLAEKIIFKWVNRNSQRRSYTWQQFEVVFRALVMPRLHIRKDLNPFRRAEAC